MLFGACLVLTVATAPTAVQVSFEADQLQVQQSRAEEVVHEQNQQTPNFYSAFGESEHATHGLCRGVDVVWNTTHHFTCIIDCLW